ncbi:hypothetical protein D3C72_2470740 [compost metagenome]
MPPTAAMAGKVACTRDESAPSSISRFTSSPTSRKKIAMKPSLIQSNSGLLMSRAAMRTCTWVLRKL